MTRAAAKDNLGNGKPSAEPAPNRKADTDGAPEPTARPPESFGRAQHQEPEKKPPLYKRTYFWVMTAVVVIGITVGGVVWWLHSRNYISTDDAFVAAHVTNISPRVAGHVIEVKVTDNQDVKNNEDLVVLDPTDFQQGVDSAQAQVQVSAGMLEQAKAQITAAEASVGQTKADISSAQANATQAEEDLKRYQSLDRRAVSPQQLDAATAAARSTHAALESARQKQSAAEAQLILARSQEATAEAQVKKAQVALDQTRTQLAYARVTAPQAGRITNRSVSVGDYVQTGQAIMGLVPTHVYVVANFKETELRDIHPGQPVQISVDAFGKKYKGHVQSIQAGSGAAFSMLPPENATGNYVKVVQRVPVKIEFDETPPSSLGPGMSVVPTVDIHNR